MTNSPDTFERSVMMSSVMPSLKYSWSGSLLMLTNGSTAIDGLSGDGKAILSTDAGSTVGSHGFNHVTAPTIPMSTTTATASATRFHACVARFGSPVTLPAASGSVSTR